MLLCIQLMVLLCMCVCSVGVEGLRKSVSLNNCLVMPGGYVRVSRALYIYDVSVVCGLDKFKVFLADMSGCWVWWLHPWGVGCYS